MIPPSLTLVSNRATALLPLPELARRAVDGGVDIVQVREPSLTSADRSRIVVEVVAAIGPARVAVNDDLGLALELGIHLHLPARSLPGFVRPDGVPSTSAAVHAADDVSRLPADVDYVVAGHLFDTASHPTTPPLGPERLREIVSGSSVPAIAIGGITPENAAEALEVGAAGVAVMSYVNSSPEPTLAARELRDAMERWMAEHTGKIDVEVNGKSISISDASTLADFLAGRNLHPRLVVVERNREIVPKTAYESTVLVDGDVLEIAHFVGGG